jgi:quinol-cytochrome oxidoreductase complex cytochrome b subunit
MVITERQLWRLLASFGVFMVAINALFLLVPWQDRNGLISGAVGGGLVGVWSLLQNPPYRDAFRSLSKVRRLAFILTGTAVLILGIFVSSWGAPDPLFYRIARIVVLIFMILVLLVLYPLFSKSMDALWLRFTRR